ncbi:uncharacterized protein LOC133030431 [Cannabis sativa]|uniref:uncharacterized protein LOC133030431 n=1 Tax=Cannabis sativa TaxID=3483 RepID=UPI0029C9DFE8|nr:uncharacterized protein LOC133030431 [Cannabis sativa]
MVSIVREYILFSHDKKEGNPDRGPSSDFRQLLDSFNLSPIDPVGPPLTWNNNVAHPKNIQERLDWGIINNSWTSLFPGTALNHLGFFGSDHRALELITSPCPGTGQSSHSKRFLFENVWLQDPNWDRILDQSWTSPSTVEEAIPNLIATQSLCAQKLNSWNHKKTFNFKNQISKLEKELELARSNSIWDNRTIETIKDLQSRLDALLYKEEAYWKQRSRTQWLAQGDKNTKFFHRFASQRKNTNKIHQLHTTNGGMVSDEEGIIREIESHFDQLFTSSSPTVSDMNTALEGISRSLSDSDKSLLSEGFSLDEIEKAFFQLPLDKAPGPDGFNSHFYKANWHVVRNDVLEAASSFLNGNASVAPLNNTLITLIPKVHQPKCISAFRPISLCNIIYKIISKTLANRLKLVLNSLISPHQSAFLPGRLISDNIIIAQEVAHSIKLKTRGKKGWMAIKLDMAKAFDRVEWPFIIAILRKFQFPPRFVHLISTCISTASFQFNLNGKVSGSVNPSRGIRQGDPLSPYLFLLCAEGFSSLLHQQERRKTLLGFKVARRAPAISHLLFADDSFLFCQANISSCNVIKEVLEAYGRATGQQVNFQKSSLYFSPNVELRDRTLISDYMGIPVRSSFEKYLGLPQHIGRSKKQLFHYLHEKVWGHLHNWKNKVFSKGGKETLLKSVIQAIPTYSMACFRLPIATCHSLESVMANFWWGVNDNNRPKTHWQSWKKLCRSKKEGGLGFRSLTHFNQALLAKQAWRILQQPNSTVSKILSARYFPHSSFLDSSTEHSPSFVWRSICWGKELLHKGLISKIGNGQNTSTTRDHWIPGLCQVPILSHVPDTVASFILPSSSWDLVSLQRCFLPHVVEQILSIPLPLSPCPDEFIWEHSQSGIYTAKSGYHISFSCSPSSDIPSSSKPSPWWKNLWHLPLPAKVKHFAFRATNSTLPTAKNLAHRKIIPSPVCDRCGGMEESVSHALFYCRSVRRVWKGTQFYPYIFANSLEILFHDIVDMIYFSLTKKDVEIFLCTAWLVWYNRNKALKNQTHDPDHAIFSLAQSFLEDYHSSQRAPSPSRPRQTSGPSSWTPPAAGLLKLNVDAALSQAARKAGFGGIIRNSDGLVVAAIAQPHSGGGSVPTLEAKSLLSALQWCINEHFLVQEVETDCKAITDALSGHKEDMSVFGDIIKQIKNTLSYFPAARLCHINRDANILADKLAHRALGLDEVAIWIGDDPFSILLMNFTERDMENNGDLISIDEEEVEVLRLPTSRAEEVAIDTRWCLVGKLLTGRVSDFNVFQNMMAFLWQPGMGMYVKELNPNLFLFQFYHEIDIQRVIDGSPWTYDRKPFIFTRLKEGDNPRLVEINQMDMWVQLHNLQPGNMTLSVITALGNFIGTFIESDPNNFVGVWRDFLRIRVRINVDKPIKRRMKVSSDISSWYWANFKYEKLPTFCFICGIIGHSERFCPRLFLKPLHLQQKPYNLELRASLQRRHSTFGAQWLRSGVVVREEPRQTFTGGSSEQGINLIPISSEHSGGLERRINGIDINHIDVHNERRAGREDFREVNEEDMTLHVNNNGNFFDSTITTIIDSKRRRPDSSGGSIVGPRNKEDSRIVDEMDQDMVGFLKNGPLAGSGFQTRPEL